MGRGQGSNEHVAEAPRNVLRQTLRCGACGTQATFDGNGGEWCPHCQTAQHLETEERIYQLVDIAL